MEIRIQPIHFEASQQLESFIQKKVGKLEKYHDGIIAAEVMLKVVKPETAMNKEASVKLEVPGPDLFAAKTSDTFEESIDGIVEALEKQLMKLKEKQRSK
ncbi:MAG: ribosome-associated translation inhibitor RaiA [Dysgonamonadaceae bacterium]|jgi:putative sigma-54 modulation protein|nr:ribosome-associated translation inhibitor RaiA [Dysgonamonadaceae bacterium]